MSSRARLGALAVLGAAFTVRAGAPPVEVAGVLEPVGAPGFAQVLAPRAFSFPADHGPHPAYRQEWWYTTGNLESAAGERFGFELTFFRYALAPAAPAAERPQRTSAWWAREIYMAHFTVTDLAQHRFAFAQKLSRGALRLAGAQGAPLKVWIDDWQLAAGPAALASWQLRAAGDGYALELELDAGGAPVLNGERGFSAKSDEPGNASYYYSLPRVTVRGRLWRGELPLEVHGDAWVDREWGSGGLGARNVGWDWFALQLSDGSTLMFYALREASGARSAHSAGTWVSPDGASRALDSGAVAIEVTDHWLSRRRVRYPSAWRVRVPQLALDLSVHPLLADQELGSTPRYWEGAVDVRGTGAAGAVQGRGYVELVGYPQER